VPFPQTQSNHSINLQAAVLAYEVKPIDFDEN